MNARADDYLTKALSVGELLVGAVLAPHESAGGRGAGEAVTIDLEGTPAKVFTAEHLAAIALQTARAKDKARLLQFVEAGGLEPARFQGILARHALLDRWHEFEQTFMGRRT